MRTLFILLSIFLTSVTQACMWDRDTLAQEYKQAPDVVKIITGRFERFPPRYYEMRLVQVNSEITAYPDNLTLYDDAGVACDRLHRSAEALEWMAKKVAEMDRQKLPPEHEHRYRYEANLGTFLIHQWLSEGSLKSGLEQARTARDHIAKAIEINPDAHFGREKYQLMAMDWIIEQVETPNSSEFPTFLKVYGEYGNETKTGFRRNGISTIEAQKGVSGLITLGAAWESIDAQAALGQTLQAQNHNQIALLSLYRIRELQEAGKQSFAPERLEKTLEYWKEGVSRMETGEDFYKRARVEADAWQKARFDYMEQKFAAGEHPDTHPDFWNDFKYAEKQPPTPPFQLTSAQKGYVIYAAFILIVFVMPALVLFFATRSTIRSRQKKSAAVQA